MGVLELINSMTGFGAAEGVSGVTRISVEVRSVNHRFFTPSLKLPSSLSQIEGELREILRTRIGRGHVTLSLRTETDATVWSGVNEERFELAVNKLRALQARHAVAGDVDIPAVLRVPGVLGSGAEAVAIDPQEVLLIAGRAVDALEEMRRTEGTRLAAFLAEHVRVVEEALKRISARSPIRLEEQRVRLRKAVQEILADIAADENRMAQEIAILADRLDITEELNRFSAHTSAFRKTLDSSDTEGSGKRLGFILQEMLRETNTIGSKANDASMLSDVVSIKEELERLREQVENVA